MKIRVRVDEIEQIFQGLIQTIKEYDIEFVDIETDYYWIITTDEWDNFTTLAPPSPVVGSLVDDFLSLQELLKNEELTFLDLERFANILRAVAETISRCK